jgi:peroxin-4
MSRDSSRGSKSKSKSSSGSALKRLTHELQDLRNTNNDTFLHLGPASDEDLFYWEAVLRGPRDPVSPYYNGLWLLEISIPSNYPNQPPKVNFKTPICHPNVHFQTGEICLTLLTSEHWAPTYTLGSTMGAIQQLLSDPGLDSPLNVDVANLYRDGDDVGAEGLVRFWTAEKRWKGEGKAGWISEKAPGTGGHLEL